jgi:MarR family transcriptional regulator, organic hydroperoxide resistance regulator
MARTQSKMLGSGRQGSSAARTARNPRKGIGRVSDIDLFNSVPALMRQVHRGLSRGMEQRIAKYGISIGTWYFLRVLWEEDGLTQSELSDRIGIVGPTTVMAINRMVRDGLAIRSTDPDDRRKGRIYLTARAKRLKTKMLDEAADFVEQALGSIPEREIQQLRMTLRKIALNLKPHLPSSVFSRITEGLGR